MANFQVTTNVAVTTTDGINLSKALTSVGLNAKDLHDDTYGPGPVAVDLAPHHASISRPRVVLVLADGDGAKLKFDGVATFTAKAYKQAFLEVVDSAPGGPGPAGVFDLELEMQGALQRLRVLAVGDPD